MSTEHGGHGEEVSIVSIIASLFLAILFAPALLEEGEKVVQSIVNPDATGHGH